MTVHHRHLVTFRAFDEELVLSVEALDPSLFQLPYYSESLNKDSLLIISPPKVTVSSFASSP